MKIFVITLFPEMFDGPFSHSIIKRAVDEGILAIELVNPREFAFNKHQSVDDSPFGGGAGMVLRPEPVIRAVDYINQKSPANNHRVVLLSPAGRKFDQSIARELSSYEQLTFICGHYEGIDDRVREAVVDEALSIGDYVLTGGELPAMVVIDAVARLVGGVLGDAASSLDESFSAPMLEYPQYTRPREYRGMAAPDILTNGNHAEISRWRTQKALEVTQRHRPDLLSEPKEK